MAQVLQDRIALAMQWGWPTMTQRQFVVQDSQDARDFSQLSDEAQRLILQWEAHPRETPISPVSEDLRAQIRKARMS